MVELAAGLTLRTDIIILDRHVIDNRQNGVDHVARPTQNRQYR